MSGAELGVIALAIVCATLIALVYLARPRR